MTSGQSNLIDLDDCEVLFETEKAFAVKNIKDETVFLPKSLVEFDEEDGTITLPEWLAEEKELI